MNGSVVTLKVGPTIDQPAPGTADRWLAAFTGHRCAACENRSATLICAACLALLPGALRPRCRICAIGLGSGEICGACLHRQPAFDASFAAFDYAAPADALIKRLKFGRMAGLARWFAAAMTQRLPDSLEADLIVPVPLAAGRLRERGFNQAWSLASETAKRLAERRGKPVLARWNIANRVIDTPALAQLGEDARAKQIRGAFLIRDPQCVEGLHVLAVDDVMTTGATMNEFARTLKRAGAARVSCLLACRTM
jgi:ComF family protein